MSNMQEGMARLLNVANNKLSAASYRDLEALVRECGYDPDNVTSDQPFSSENSKRILDALSNELGVDDLDDLISALADVTEGQDDTVPPFPGKPEVGGKITAQDRKHRFRKMALDHIYKRRSGKPATWDSIVPEAARIEASPAHVTKSDHAIGQDSAAITKWEREFKDAARIKI